MKCSSYRALQDGVFITVQNSTKVRKYPPHRAKNNFHLPDSHSLFNVSRGQILVQIDDKLCKLLHVDDIFRLLSVSVDDLGTTGHLLETKVRAEDSLQE